MIVAIVIVLISAALAAALAVAVYTRRPSGSPVPDDDDAELAALERSGDPLLRTVARLSRRVTLGEQFHRRLRLIVRVLIGAVAALLVMAVAVAVLVVDARHRSDQRDTDQADARYAGCVQYNVAQVNTREAIVRGVVGGFRPIAEAAGKSADLEDFARVLRASVDVTLPYRDCSPSGIAGYLQHPPPDPATQPTTTTVPSPPSTGSG